MAGPAVRALQLGRVLAAHGEVVLAGPEPSVPPPGWDGGHVTYRPHDWRALRGPIFDADVVIAQPQWPVVTRWMRESGARLIFDLFVPEHLEALERYGRMTLRARLLMAFMRDRLSDAFRVGHHFVCATERQRDMWIGAMTEAGVPAPELELVPYGTPPEEPVATGAGGAVARFDAVSEGDDIVLWGSAIWAWFDAATPIRAVARLREKRPRLRLVFMGQATGASAAAADAARALARELGVLDTHVFFNDRWVPYAERVDWLLEASCAVSTHYDNLETRFSFRTRLLDCFWSRLPIVATEGDELSELIERERLGRAVPERDVDAVAAALDEVLEQGRAAYADRLGAVAERFTWPRVAEPLVRWIESDSLPPRMGEGAPRRGAGHAIRSAAYSAASAALATTGAARISRVLTAPESPARR